MKCRVRGNIVSIDAEPDAAGVGIYDMILYAFGPDPINGALACTFASRECPVLMVDDLIEVYGVMESLEPDDDRDRFFYVLRAQSIRNHYRHTDYETCYSPLWESDE